MLKMSKDSVLKNMGIITELGKNSNNVDDASFNVFNVLRIQTNEILVCRFLGAILDPCGQHNLGTFPLKSFIENVLRKDEETEENLSNATISLEDRVNMSSEERQYGRADIVIRTATNIYPIEVKIFAGDQPRQLIDYYKFYFGDVETGTIYYLTPEGREPTSTSKGNLSDDQLKLLSFSKDIYTWLDVILKNCNDVNDTIRQYQEAILSMIDNNESIQNIKDSITFNDADNVEMIKVLNIICQQDNATEIRKEIQRKYWEKRIQFSREDYEYGDLESNRPGTFQWPSEVFSFVKSKTDDSYKVWIGADKRSLYFVYRVSESKYEYKRMKDKKMDDFDLSEFDISEMLMNLSNKLYRE